MKGIGKVEHFGIPNGDVCREGLQHHDPHLAILLKDTKVYITPEDGEPQFIEAKSGTSIWFES